MRCTACVLCLSLVGATAYAAPRREVFGYYPYWTRGSGTSGWRWDLLTTVAYFSADLDPNGDVTSWHGWYSAPGMAFVADAHAHGVRAVLCVTNFNKVEI